MGFCAYCTPQSVAIHWGNSRTSTSVRRLLRPRRSYIHGLTYSPPGAEAQSTAVATVHGRYQRRVQTQMERVMKSALFAVFSIAFVGFDVMHAALADIPFASVVADAPADNGSGTGNESTG